MKILCLRIAMLLAGSFLIGYSTNNIVLCVVGILLIYGMGVLYHYEVRQKHG